MAAQSGRVYQLKKSPIPQLQWLPAAHATQKNVHLLRTDHLRETFGQLGRSHTCSGTGLHEAILLAEEQEAPDDRELARDGAAGSGPGASGPAPGRRGRSEQALLGRSAAFFDIQPTLREGLYEGAYVFGTNARNASNAARFQEGAELAQIAGRGPDGARAVVGRYEAPQVRDRGSLEIGKGRF